jgi:hypothetical protein
MLSSRCRAILCAKLRQLANTPPSPAPVPPPPIQPPPSRNIKQMAGAAFGTGALALGDLGAIGLLNTSQRGEWFVIWDLFINTVPNPIPAHAIVADINIVSGRPFNALLPPPETNPITSDTATLPGQVWWFGGPGNESGKTFYSVTLITTGVVAYYQWVHDHPICAIKPGDSIAVYSDADPYTDWGVNFMYEVVPGGI